jgi:hypothetical protein
MRSVKFRAGRSRRSIVTAACAAFAALPFLASTGDAVTLQQCEGRFNSCLRFCAGGSQVPNEEIRCGDQCYNNLGHCYTRASDKIPDRAKPPTRTGTGPIHPPVHAGGGALQPPSNAQPTIHTSGSGGSARRK